MFKSFFAALGLLISLNAQANTITTLAFDLGNAVLSDVEMKGPFKFKVGDEASYKMNMGGFIIHRMMARFR